jgi:ATP-dependent DNA ligase
MFRREWWPYFMAFDLLWLDAKDLPNRPLVERKRHLALHHTARGVAHLRSNMTKTPRPSYRHQMRAGHPIG